MPSADDSKRANAVVRVSRKLCAAVSKLQFGADVSHVYNPLEYAREPHENYLRRYGVGKKRLLFIGMNPGPFGMAQTGVPFGDVTMVRDFLRISGTVKRPAVEHPKRPVLGFECQRSEVSGTRVWGFFRERFGTADALFRHVFVANYCPLCFMEPSGKNRTPDQLPSKERDALYELCDGALAELVEALEAQTIVAIGGFAEKRAKAACSQWPHVRVVCVLHPSPANPRANRGWAAEVQKDLLAAGIDLGE